MSTFQKIMYALLMLVMVGFLFHAVRQNPQWLTRENLGKSFFVMGVLALLLIGFIGLCVYFLRQS